MAGVKKPKADQRIKGPRGSASCRGGIVHCTISDPREGPTDRYGIVDYLASLGISVPMVADDEGSTQMVPDGWSGAYHTRGLTDVWGIEQIGQATWSRKTWLQQHRETVRQTGQWGAWLLAEVLDVAVTKKNLKRLFVGHDRDHIFGGTSDHWDPGPEYPWDVCYADAIEYAGKSGYRTVAIKGDEKRIRTWRASRKRQAYAWGVKRLKKGWRVVVKRQKFAPDHDFGPQAPTKKKR